jgi:hypothetical protein
MTSDEAVGPLDIAKLLALLNASEEGATPANSEDGATLGNHSERALPLSEPEQSGEKIEQHQEVFTATTAQAELVAPDSPVPHDVENRFAAHIVHGMSKLKAR